MATEPLDKLIADALVTYFNALVAEEERANVEGREPDLSFNGPVGCIPRGAAPKRATIWHAFFGKLWGP